MWIQSLLSDLYITIPTSMKLRCDNRACIYIANNPMFHKLTKHVKVNYHYTCDLIQHGLMHIASVSSKDQTANIFTKPPTSTLWSVLQLSMDKYAPTWGGVLETNRKPIKDKCMSLCRLSFSFFSFLAYCFLYKMSLASIHQ